MAHPATPHALRICELLEDGDWRDFEYIIREAGKTIPPGRAMRVAEQDRARMPGAPAHRARTRSDEQLIRTGRRRIIYDTLRTSAFEIRRNSDGTRDVRMIRLPDPVRHARRRQEAHG